MPLEALQMSEPCLQADRDGPADAKNERKRGSQVDKPVNSGRESAAEAETALFKDRRHSNDVQYCGVHGQHHRVLAQSCQR